MNTFSKTVLKLAVATAMIAPAGAAFAEFPEKPITMYIGFNPGGAVDTTARLLQQNLEKELGVPVVTSNQATFWSMLRAVGLQDRFQPFGRLLSSH